MPHSRFRRFARTGAALAMALTAGLVSAPAAAQGDLLIAPTRVIISQGGTSQNQSAETEMAHLGDPWSRPQAQLERLRETT